jgi:hypothetical protein
MTASKSAVIPRASKIIMEFLLALAREMRNPDAFGLSVTFLCNGLDFLPKG